MHQKSTMQYSTIIGLVHVSVKHTCSVSGDICRSGHSISRSHICVDGDSILNTFLKPIYSVIADQPRDCHIPCIWDARRTDCSVSNTIPTTTGKGRRLRAVHPGHTDRGCTWWCGTQWCQGLGVWRRNDQWATQGRYNGGEQLAVWP